VEFDIGYFNENLPRNSNLVKIEQIYWAVHMKTKVRFSVAGDILVNSPKKKIAKHSLFLYCWQ